MVHPPAGGQQPVRGDADDVLDVSAPVHFPPSAGGGAGGIAAEVSLLVGLAVHVRFLKSRDQVLAGSHRVLPLNGKSDLLGGDNLGASQILAVAVGRDRRKGLMQALTGDVGMQLEGADLMRVPVSAQIQFANGGAVGLQRSAVVPRFAEQRSPNKDTAAIAKLALQGEVTAGVLRIHGRVHRASQVGGHGDVAVGAEEFRGQADGPGSKAFAGGQRKVGRVLISVGGFERNRIPVHRRAKNIDDSAERVGTVEMRGAAAGDFDAADAHARHPVPIHPAAEGIVQRKAVTEYQGAAGAARAQTAQGDALRGRDWRCGWWCGGRG